MADKTIGSLPAAESVDDTSLLVMEQQGAAMKVTGALIKGYAAAAVAGYVDDAKKAAETATKSSEEAVKASQDAETASMEAQNAQQGAEKARQAIENLGVEGETLDPGQQVAVVKTVGADGTVTLTFKIPQGAKGETGDTGDQGETGPQGVSVTDAEITEDGELILTLSNQQTVNAGHVVGPQGPQGGQGEPGSSVASVQRTQGTGAAGTTDTYTMYNEDGEAVGTFQVYNGTNGTGSGDFMADGSVPMTGALQMGGNRVTNVGAPTAATDAVRKQEFDTAVDLASTAAQAAADASMAVEELEGSSPLAVKVVGESSYTYTANYTAYKIYQEAQAGRPVFASLGGAQYSLIECAALSASTYEAKFALVEDDKQKTLSITSTQTENTAISTGEINMGGGNYLPLSGGTMQGDVNFSAGEDPSMSRGVKFTVNMESAHLHGLNEGSGTILEASDQMGELVRLRFADPVASTDGATKGYVDGKAPLIVTVTETDGEYSADYTAYQIIQAVKAGTPVFAFYGIHQFPLVRYVDSSGNYAYQAIFEYSYNGARLWIRMQSNSTENTSVMFGTSDPPAQNVSFTPGTTGLSADNVQDAIEELAGSGGGSGGPKIWKMTYEGTGSNTVDMIGFGAGNIPDDIFIIPLGGSTWHMYALLSNVEPSYARGADGDSVSINVQRIGANGIMWDSSTAETAMNVSGIYYLMIGIKYSPS